MLHIQETYVNGSEKTIYGESPVVETFTADTAELFRSLQREHGRCVSKMYMDTKDGETRQTGWVFQKRDNYQDSDQEYIRETWVSVFTDEPEKVVQWNFSTPWDER